MKSTCRGTPRASATCACPASYRVASNENDSLGYPGGVRDKKSDCMPSYQRKSHKTWKKKGKEKKIKVDSEYGVVETG